MSAPTGLVPMRLGLLNQSPFITFTGHLQRLFLCPKTCVFGSCRVQTPGTIVSGSGGLLDVFLLSVFSVIFSGVAAEVQFAGPEPTADAKDSEKRFQKRFQILSYTRQDPLERLIRARTPKQEDRARGCTSVTQRPGPTVVVHCTNWTAMDQSKDYLQTMSKEPTWPKTIR